VTGEYLHTIDEKGRLFVPAKLRETLGEVFYVTKGLDHCLNVYPEAGWQELEQKLRALPMSKSRNLQRFFFAGAAECRPDSHGRIVIAQNLREYAHLEREVCFIGVADHAEIWDAQAWRQMNDSVCSDAQQMAEIMEELGF